MVPWKLALVNTGSHETQVMFIAKGDQLRLSFNPKTQEIGLFIVMLLCESEPT